MHSPDKWVVLKISEDLYKVFATWYGGYISSDVWRMNSGIVSVEDDEDFYYFKGYSNSVYKCHKNSYGSSLWTRRILNNMIEKAKEAKNIDIVVLEETVNFKELFNKKMNNEKMNQIIDEAYKNYTNYPLATRHDHHTNILYRNMHKGWCMLNGRSMVSPHPTRHLTQEEFINKCKTDSEFSETWELRIEERELSSEERYKIWFKNNFETGMEYNENNLPDFENDYYKPTPTRLITITYNNETIDIYE